MSKWRLRLDVGQHTEIPVWPRASKLQVKNTPHADLSFEMLLVGAADEVFGWLSVQENVRMERQKETSGVIYNMKYYTPASYSFTACKRLVFDSVGLLGL